MRRLITRKLAEWKDLPRRKPLIVRGARQVGKTFSILQFGREHFETVATVDLERNRNLHRVFSADLDPKRIISELEIFLDTKLTPGSTLLFLDEVQSCPRAIMALRYFHEEHPDLHVIAAGSLLEFAMQEVSFPVGRVQFLEMFPMSFAEFLRAVGKEEAAKVVSSSPQRLPEATHELLLNELRNYCFVGGMPESVRTYVESSSLRECFAVHEDLVESFRHDFSKYSPRVNSRCLNGVLTGVARDLGKQIIYTHLMEGFSHHTIKQAFDTLCMARITARVSSANPGGLPLAATAQQRRFKAIMVDVGLWQHLCGISVDTEYPKSDLLDVYRGAMAEQFVGQEMLISQNSQLHYWARSARGSTAEVDYIGTIGNTVVPVEVKSGAAGRLRSLHLLIESFPNVPRGVVFSSRPYEELPDQKLVFTPIYYAFSATGGAI